MLYYSSLFFEDGQLATEVYDLLLTQHIGCVLIQRITYSFVSLSLKECLLLQILVHLQEGFWGVLIPNMNHFPPSLFSYLLKPIIQVERSPSSGRHFSSRLQGLKQGCEPAVVIRASPNRNSKQATFLCHLIEVF